MNSNNVVLRRALAVTAVAGVSLAVAVPAYGFRDADSWELDTATHMFANAGATFQIDADIALGSGVPAGVLRFDERTRDSGAATSAMFDPAVSVNSSDDVIGLRTRSYNDGSGLCDGDFGVATTGDQELCSSMGTVTFDFEHPVFNPTLHMIGLGRALDGDATYDASGSIQLTLASSVGNGVAIGAVGPSAQNLTVAGNTIRVTDPTNLTGRCDGTNSSGCGSVQVLGMVSSITFEVARLAVANSDFGSGGGATGVPVGNQAMTTRLWWTLTEDWGDLPTAYPNAGGSNADAHAIITDLRLGSLVDEDNAAVSDGDDSTNASAGATGDDDTALNDDDGITLPALDVSMAGGNYTVTAAITGASDDAGLCGWIDFNQDSVLDVTERACADVTSGQTTADLTWSLASSGPSMIAEGTYFAEFKLGYLTSGGDDFSELRSRLMPGGEVESYALDVLAAPQATFDLAVTERSDSGDGFILRVNDGSTSQDFATGTSGTAVSSGVITGMSGTAITARVLAADVGTDLANYVFTLTCSNATTSSTTTLPSGTTSSASLTLAGGDDVTCTLSADAALAATGPSDAALTGVIAGSAVLVGIAMVAYSRRRRL